MIMGIRGAYAIRPYTDNPIFAGNRIKWMRIYQIFIPYG